METIPITNGRIASPTSYHACFSRAMTTSDITLRVAGYFNVELVDLLGRRRTARIALIRQIAMALSYKWTDDSFAKVGTFFGRDHGTVMHAITAIRNRASYDKKVAKCISDIEHPLGSLGLGRVVT